MNIQDFVSKAVNTVGKEAFAYEMEVIGWRGDFEDDPINYIVDAFYDMDRPNLDEFRAMVETDVIYILNVYGYDYVDGQIVDIVAR